MLNQHKWIYVALAVLVASLAAHKSAWLLTFLFILLLLLLLKGEQRAVIALMLGSGFFSYGFIMLGQQTEPSPLPSQILITWTNEYKVNGQKLRGFVQTATKDKLYVVYTFHSEQEKNFFAKHSLAGSVYQVQGELVEPAPKAHAYAFSMNDYLKSKGARGIFEVTEWTFVQQRQSFQTWLAQQRHRMKVHIEQTFPPSLVAEAQALLFGIQDEVDDELQRAYQKLGITHLFAISGLHVALISWLFFEGLLRLHVRKGIATFSLLLILPIYGVLAGSAPSVWRAVSVVELILLLRYFNWRLAIDDALAWSFIGFVLLEPGVIFQVGFQLSYLATASLIYSNRILKEATNWLLRSFLITFVCQLLVYPLLLYHFYEISLSSFIANIFFVPLFSFIILPINIFLFLLTFISMPLVHLCFVFYEPLRLWLTAFIFFLQQLPYQLWSPGRPAIWLCGIAMVSAIVSLYFLEIKRYVLCLIVLFLPACWIHWSPMFFSEMKITFLNVGQGDCTIIELPYRKAVYMIDAGGVLRFQQARWKASKQPYEVGKQVVVPFLKGKGIRMIDIFIVTHADADHVEGAEEVLQEIAMGEIHVTPQSTTKQVMQDILKEAQKRHVPVKEKMQGTSWQVRETVFQYLWPHDTDYEGNNDSIVLYIQHGRFRGLLTGDLEEAGEQGLQALYGEHLANLTLLKAGHHGSKTSSSEPFVELVRPMLTVFSAGLHNRYHHPHQEVVERFHRRQLPTWTTGIDGTLEIKIKKDLVQ
ncbi:DNA internalization-related competence protein ComEC/Rec2 [Lysinibacillus piscis]|uniref:DNA internalization-related competence protein ComEC/Rec2 n=1 Tax=Lysinibacillus piscis TaxID=2518931 RepID=A0ABQ5NKD6_9BACI|nr:DNA internalization-related competence protein ComEC/Rec2 [Lysinibacillus sp. KH24]GLC88537.1 DNA internalization-related competence protein ComEC/Rec2 [Lysinibacillus sp. KH24]